MKIQDLIKYKILQGFISYRCFIFQDNSNYTFYLDKNETKADIMKYGKYNIRIEDGWGSNICLKPNLETTL